MTTISAEVILDSINKDGARLTTTALYYPRFIHAELMTHRVFTRNASSSRAIPVDKMIQAIIDDTAMPLHWGKNQPGMQADEECYEWIIFPEGPTNERLFSRRDMWLKSRDYAIEVARAYSQAGYHKQIVNRLLEPFAHINVLVTSCYWRNFYALRRHKDAQPEIKALADEVFKAIEASTPTLLDNEWHLPFVTHKDRENLSNSELIKCSVARCARVSYLTTERKIPTFEQDIKLYDRLLSSEPLHASPAEHVAFTDWKDRSGQWANPWHHGNFKGWRQYRKMLKNESVMENYG